MHDEPWMQWGAGVSVLANWGEGPESGWLVMVVKNVWLHSEALFRMNGNMCRMADPTFDPYRGCGTVVGGASRRRMRQKLRKISSLKLQTSDCESISFRIESSSLSSPSDPLRSFQCEAQA